MLTKRIIPCLDVKGGRVVKGVQFLELRDAGDPVEIAEIYDRQGADELTFLDITASSDKRDIVSELVRRVADQVFIPFTVGGGLRSLEDIRAVLRSGADKVSLNTPAIEQPELINEAAETFAETRDFEQCAGHYFSLLRVQPCTRPTMPFGAMMTKATSIRPTTTVTLTRAGPR